MKENQGGKRKAPGIFPVGAWWTRYRAWAAGLSRGQRVRYRVCQVLAILAVLLAALALYLHSWIRLPDVPSVPSPPDNPGASDQSSGSQSLPGDLEYEGAELPQVSRSGQKPGYYTFLVCGQDEVSGATDTMLLFTYDTKGQRVSAISLLRDTMINTKANSKRLNTVYARNRGSQSLPEKERVENGMSALKQEVSKLTGIYPNFYVLVEWDAIGELVDALGGVYFDVPPGMDYDDPYQDLHIHQEAGYRLLDGRDAMEVIRFRKNNDESVVLYDAGRTQIQRDFLAAVLKKCLTPEILLKLPALVQIFVDNVDTDLTIGNILAFAQLAVGMDTENGLNFVSMPFDNAAYRGASLTLARQDELLELLNDGLNPYQDEIQASDLQLMYRKRGGGYDVTNAELADPAMGRVTVSPPKNNEPEETGGDGTETPPDPEDTDGSQAEEDSALSDLGTIDPGDIFPPTGALEEWKEPANSQEAA